MRLKDRIVVITGGARGIGRACAERFHADGAKVVIGDIDGAGLEDARGAIPEVHTVLADVSKRIDVDRLITETVRKFGRVDVMLNNAGIVKNQDFMSITDEDFETVLGINLRGAFFGVQAAARQMLAQGDQPRRGGVIINMSSINALLANPSIATYAMSKGGMNQLTTTASIALAPHGVRVVGIGPGTILTELAAQVIMTSDAARRSVLSRTPLGRCGEPREVAAVAAFLASDDASYITGQTIYPDGGRMALNYTVPVAE